MELSSIEFRGKLNLQPDIARQSTIINALRDIATQIKTSLSGEWCVSVWAQSDNREKWVPAGIHKFILKASDEDPEYKVQSLVVSWQTMLSVNRQLQPLALAIYRPNALHFEEDAGEEKRVKHAPVAKPDSEPLKGEWFPEAPRYTKQQWIVSAAIMQRFDDAVSIIKNSDKIYYKWGFAEVDPNPRAVLCFYGPAGTGKTMAAHVLASELGRNIISANYSQIESKYVGEAPKNLKRVFDTAKESGAVLFFDEADSFLGKRIENVSSGSEQAINSLRGEMLILLEDFRGVVVFATNLLTNIDRAFESRIISKIEFEMPNADARRVMIKSKIPPKAPLAFVMGEKELDRLVELSDGFSGRVIRSAMLMSFVKAARHSEETGTDAVSFKDFEQAFTEQKEMASRIDAQYKKSSPDTGFKVEDAAQQPLLEIASQAISDGKFVTKKIN